MTQHSDTAPVERRRDDDGCGRDSASIADADLLAMARTIRRATAEALEAKYAALAGQPMVARWEALSRLYLIRRELRRRTVRP